MHSRLTLSAFVAAASLSASISAQPLPPEASPLAAQAHAVGHLPVGALDYAVGPATTVGVQWGQVLESNGLLGVVPADAFSSNGARARSVGVWANHRLGEAWQLAAQYSVALADTVSAAGSSFALGLLRHSALIDEDRLSLTLSSPMSVTTAGAHIGLPATITVPGEEVFGARRTASTTSRELRLGLNYEMPLSRESSVTWVLDLNHNPRRVPGETDQRIVAILRTRF